MEAIIESGSLTFAITVIVLLLFLLWAQAVIDHTEREEAQKHLDELDRSKRRQP